MPLFDIVTKAHLKAILAGKKKLLKMSEVQFVNSPAFDEIGVKALYAKEVENPLVKIYFPDEYPKGRYCDKQYMYNVWNTIEPADVKEII